MIRDEDAGWMCEKCDQSFGYWSSREDAEVLDAAHEWDCEMTGCLPGPPGPPGIVVHTTVIEFPEWASERQSRTVFGPQRFTELALAHYIDHICNLSKWSWDEGIGCYVRHCTCSSIHDACQKCNGTGLVLAAELVDPNADSDS